MALRKEVRLCDTCQNKVSTCKCDCCNGDMCNECLAFSQNLRVNTLELVTLLYCANCKARYLKSSTLSKEFFDAKFKHKMGEELKEYIKGRMLSEAL